MTEGSPDYDGAIPAAHDSADPVVMFWWQVFLPQDCT